MAEKTKLTRSDILRTMAKRTAERSQMMICLMSGGCVMMLVMLLCSNWVWSNVHGLIGIIFGGVPCVAIPVLLFNLAKVLWYTHQQKQDILQGDITVIKDELREIGKHEEVVYSTAYATRFRKIIYDVFEFARGNTFVMKEDFWTEAEKRRARDQFGVGHSFILVIYQKRSWELQLIYPEALYEYVDDTEETT